jgi:hypothetical protein
MRYKNREVAEIFVNRHGKDAAKSYSHHLHCDDGILYSYSTPIAIWSWKLRQVYVNLLGDNPDVINPLSNLIFLTDNRYSATTACHESYLRYAGNGQVREVPAEINLLMDSPSKFFNCLREKTELSRTKLTRVRTEHMREYWQNLQDNSIRLSEIFRPIVLLEIIKWPERRDNVNLDFAA